PKKVADQLLAEFDRKRQRSTAVEGESSKAFTIAPDRGRGGNSKSNFGSREESTSEDGCFNCGDRTHYARSCPLTDEKTTPRRGGFNRGNFGGRRRDHRGRGRGGFRGRDRGRQSMAFLATVETTTKDKENISF